MHPLKIFVIAGEVSGDLLAEAILQAVAGQSGRRLDIRGIGGMGLKNVGLGASLIPIQKLAVMGIAEILPQIFFFIRAINQTVRAIEGFKPDIVLSIDSPDFCFRVQKKVRARGHWRAQQIHVVAPSVWAWRPGRAAKIARFLDGLICFFPFEPPYFEKHGLRAIAMGHPAINGPVATANGAPLRDMLGVGTDEKILGLYLGSRAGVIHRHLGIFAETVRVIARDHPGLTLLIPTFPEYADEIRAQTQNLPLRVHIIADPLLKPAAMRACDYALAVSGTVGLELAIANVPHVVGYQMNPVTWWIGQRLVKRGQFAHLANIVQGQAVVPECIQAGCTPDALARAVSHLIQDETARQTQQEHFKQVREKIGAGAVDKPADKAARFVLEGM